MKSIDLIGNTPMVQLQGFDTGPCTLFAKLECQNPGGSIKDRIALTMIEQAEKAGLIRPGYTLVEATAGNTGIALAWVGAQKGYKTLLVMPDKMSREKIAHLRALGAEVVLARSDVGKGHPDYYQDRAKRLASEMKNAWYVDQFSNPANPLAHEQSTGPEILEQMKGQVDAVVLGVGSGGTLGGLTHFFKKHSPQTELVLADPVGSILAPFIRTGNIPDTVGSWLVEGIGEDFIPSIADFSLVKSAYAISDQESFEAARTLLKTNGLLGGSSTGTLLAAALKFCRDQRTPKRVVTFVCDGGAKYLSKMYNDHWMMDQGFLPRSSTGDLRDLISRPFSEGALVTAQPQETLRSVYSRMKTYDVSQLPVVENSRVVGIIDESDLLFAMRSDTSALSQSVGSLMSRNLEVLAPSESLDRVIAILRQGMVAIIADAQHFYGVVTHMDVVDFLKRKF